MYVNQHPVTPPDKARFILPVRVYYEDTDAAGVVYYANYLKFCERARTDWLRDAGFEQRQLASEHDVVFVVRSVHADYFRAAVLDDMLTVVSTLDKLGHASLCFCQQVMRGEELIFEARVTIACMHRATQRATPFPAAVRAQFATLV